MRHEQTSAAAALNIGDRDETGAIFIGDVDVNVTDDFDRAAFERAQRAADEDRLVARLVAALQPRRAVAGKASTSTGSAPITDTDRTKARRALARLGTRA
jgi:hypothetical protein